MPRVQALQQSCILKLYLQTACLFILLLTGLSHAVKLSLPHDVSYTFESGKSTLKKHSYSHMDMRKDKDETQLTLEKQRQQGFVRYVYGDNKKFNREARGDLYITVVVPADDQATAKSVGVRYFKDGVSCYDEMPESTSLVKNVTFSEEQIGSLESRVQMSEPQTLAPVKKEGTKKKLPMEVKTAAKSHVLWSKVSDVQFEDLELGAPKLMLESGIFQFKTDGVVPLEPVTLVLHFIPSDDSPASLVIHSCTGSSAAVSAEGGDRELEDHDLNDLSVLDTLDTFVTIARQAGITDADIKTVRATNAVDHDKSLDLLQRIKQKLGDGFTSEYLAGLCEKVSKGTLANRIRTGALTVTIEDQDLQTEMSTMGQFITAVDAEKLAMNMGFLQSDASQIAKASQPGFQLLYKAFEQRRLGRLYSSCDKVMLEELPYQIRAKHPLLHSTVLKQEKMEKTGSGSVVASLDPVPYEHLDEDLLRIPLTSRQVGDQISSRKFSEERKKQLAEQISQTTGHRVEEDRLEHADLLNTFYCWEEKDFGGGLSVEKWLHFVNGMRELDMLSMARSFVKDLEQGDIELETGQWNKLASHHADTDRNKALSMLLARGSIGYHDKLSQHVSHDLGIKCDDNACETSVKRGYNWVRVRGCDHLPTLEQEARTLGLTPFSFRVDKN